MKHSLLSQSLSLSLLVAMVITLYPTISAQAQDSATPGQSAPQRTPTFPQNDGNLMQPYASVDISKEDIAFALGIPINDLVSTSLGSSDPIGAMIATTPLNSFPIQGDTFVILSTGQATDAYLPNNSNSLSYELAGLNNSQGNDLNQLTLRLHVPTDANCMMVDFAFFSEEFPEFVGSSYNDTFTIEEGGTNLQISQNQVSAPLNFAYDKEARLISVNTVLGVTSNTGTTYDGATSVLTAQKKVPSGQTITVVLSIQDLGDSIYDSAVFLDRFRWSSDENCGVGSTSKPPLLVVHGIQTLNFDKGVDSGYSCRNEPERYFGDTSTLGDLPGWFSDDYDVWLAYLDTSYKHTPSIETNSRCLRTQVDYLYRKTGTPIVLVAHSMGGLVSRACLSDTQCRSQVSSLYTIGSPHGGLNWGLVVKAILKIAEEYAKAHSVPLPVNDGVCLWQTALCQMSTENMVLFNASNPNQPAKNYTFIGGTATPTWLGKAIWLVEGSNDGIVGSRSAVGWTSATKWFIPPSWPQASVPNQFFTDEIHSKVDAVFTGDYHAYYDNRSANGYEGKSQSYACILSAMGKIPNSNLCSNPQAIVSSAQVADAPIYNQMSALFSGVISNATTISNPVVVDSAGPVMFAASWTNGVVAFYLLSPTGQVIDPAYAAANPDAVSFSLQQGSTESGGSGAYEFQSTPPGTWQVILSGVDVGEGAGYVSHTSVSSNLGLNASYTLATSSNLLSIMAVLQRDEIGLPGATVTATLSQLDGMEVQIPLNHVANGTYANTHSLPPSGGFMPVDISASGVENGLPFHRETSLIVPVIPDNVQLVGATTARTVDDNGDGLFESLLLDIPINTITGGVHNFAADLRANGEMIATSSESVQLLPGSQIVTLAFSGVEIRARGLNGPYTVTKLTLTDSSLGLQVATAENIWVSPPYIWEQFGGCYALTLINNPSFGGAILPNPPPNCANGTLYSVDTHVSLSASPAESFIFANWIGDAQGLANSVTISMGTDKTVAANYLEVTWGDPASVSASAEPSVAVADNVSQIIVQALVQDANNNIIPGQIVTFTSTIGNVSHLTATTNAAGVASCVVTADIDPF